MAKKKKGNKPKYRPITPRVWKTNKDLQNLAKEFLASDGRLTKNRIIELTSKSMYDRLNGLGFIKGIKNADKDVYKTCSKFQNGYRENCDSNKKWGGSGGKYHSKYSSELINNILPKKVIEENRFKSTGDVEAEHKKVIRRVGFRENVKNMVQNKKEEIQNYKIENEGKINEYQYNKGLKALNRDLESLTKGGYQGFSPTDLIVQLSRDEYTQTLDNLDAYVASNPTIKKIIKDAIKKSIERGREELRSSQGDSFTVHIEIATKYYTEVEISEKVQYAEALGCNCLIYGRQK